MLFIVEFFSETWVLSAGMISTLEGMYARVAKWITRMRLKQKREGGWDYLHLTEVLKSAKFLMIREYMGQQHNEVADWVAMRLLVDLCLQTKDPVGEG